MTDSAHDTAGGFTSQKALNSAVSAHSVVASDSVDGISTPIPHADTSSAELTRKRPAEPCVSDEITEKVPKIVPKVSLQWLTQGKCPYNLDKIREDPGAISDFRNETGSYYCPCHGGRKDGTNDDGDPIFNPPKYPFPIADATESRKDPQKTCVICGCLFKTYNRGRDLKAAILRHYMIWHFHPFYMPDFFCVGCGKHTLNHYRNSDHFLQPHSEQAPCGSRTDFSCIESSCSHCSYKWVMSTKSVIDHIRHCIEKNKDIPNLSDTELVEMVSSTANMKHTIMRATEASQFQSKLQVFDRHMGYHPPERYTLPPTTLGGILQPEPLALLISQLTPEQAHGLFFLWKH